jgi:gliding motility-associated-like protein
VSFTNTASNLAAGNYSVTVSDGSCTGAGSELVTNSDFSSGNTGFSSSYSFCSSGGCMGPEGTYSVGTNPNFYNGGFFGSDHTTGSGNMMVVNGAGTPGANVWCETISVSPGTTYLFSTWVSSLNASSPAILQFSINGVNLGNTFNAPSSANIWSQFFTTWNSGANTSAQICIVNQNTSTGGNDFGLDDISFKPCSSSCTAITTFTISEPSAMSLTPSQANVSCFGGSNGSATVSVTGGSSPYSYQWTGSASATNTATGLSAGSYSVTVSDANGCSSAQSFTITEPSSAVDVNLVSQQNISCFGFNDGEITVSVSGGVTPYTYQWLMNVSNSNVADSLITGTHGVLVSDANGCQDTMSFVITQPPVFSSTASQTNISCFGGNDGSASITASGGATPYSYQWSNSATTSSQSSLIAGTYSVTASDANGCTTIQNYTLSQPSAPLSLASSFNNVSCNGGSNGSASVTPSGGTAPYSYTWSPAVSASGNATNLTAGAYDVTVTDSKNCTTSQNFTITEPSALALSVSSANVNCNNACDGTSAASLSGGVSPYSYTWSPPPGSGQGSPTAIGLCAGSYSLTVTDSNGCTSFSSFVITQPSAFTITTDSTNSNCSQNDGSAGVTLSGATTPYSYLWDDAQTSPTANNITGGIHCLTITDANACDTTVCITVIDNPPPTATATATSAICNGDCNGTAAVSAMGGNPPGSYTYLWSNAQTQATLFSLCAGAYDVTVTDSKNCTAVASATVTEPTAVSLMTGTDTIICTGGSASLSAIAGGGNGSPYTYSWDNTVNTSTQTVTPSANSCYIVSATDAQNCPSPSDTQCVSILPAVTLAGAITPDTICNGDPVQLSATASGGDGSYTYQWQEIGGSFTSTSSSTTHTPGGSYPLVIQYEITADDGCSPMVKDTVQLSFYQNPTANFTANTTFGCSPLTVTFTNMSTDVAGLNTCTWNFGSGYQLFPCNQPVTIPFPNVGQYDVELTVTSVNGSFCIDKEIKTQYIQVNPNPTADFSATPQPTNVQNMLIEFSDLSSGNGSNLASWQWQFYDNDQQTMIGSDSVQNPEFNFSSTSAPTDYFTYFLEDTGDYPVTLIILTEWGCRDTVEKTVRIDGVYYMNIPNAFSPNGDGINDVFFPSGVGIMPAQNYSFYIFNRWGDMISESHNLSQGWDGKDKKGEPVPEGVYVWRLDLDNVLGEHKKFIGHVTVIGN